MLIFEFCHKGTELYDNPQIIFIITINLTNCNPLNTIDIQILCIKITYRYIFFKQFHPMDLLLICC